MTDGKSHPRWSKQVDMLEFDHCPNSLLLEFSVREKRRRPESLTAPLPEPCVLVLSSSYAPVVLLLSSDCACQPCPRSRTLRPPCVLRLSSRTSTCPPSLLLLSHGRAREACVLLLSSISSHACKLCVLLLSSFCPLATLANAVTSSCPLGVCWRTLCPPFVHQTV